MPYGVFVAVEIKPEHVGEFKRVMAIDVAGSRKEERCRRSLARARPNRTRESTASLEVDRVQLGRDLAYHGRGVRRLEVRPRLVVIERLVMRERLRQQDCAGMEGGRASGRRAPTQRAPRWDGGRRVQLARAASRAVRVTASSSYTS